MIQRGRLDRAAEVCARVLENAPEDPVGYYNLAGVYALRGDADEALRLLERNVELGDRNHDYVESDVWFESLREDPRYRELVARMKVE